MICIHEPIDHHQHKDTGEVFLSLQKSNSRSARHAVPEKLKMASVWQLTILAYPDRTFLYGVVLNQGTSTSKGSSSTASNFWAIASSYFRKTHMKSTLRAEWGGSSFTTRIDQRGSFSLNTELPLNEKHKLRLFLDGTPLPVESEVMNCYSLGNNSNLIISDIDDTVLVSHTNQRLKSVMTTLFRTYIERKPVESTSKIFGAVQAKSDYFFVSRSEYNLFPLLSNFMKHNELPAGPLFLTPFISFGELLWNDKDPEFKVRTINLLLDHASHERIFLFGDDTQYDLQVYAEVAKMHGDRIKRIFIRQAEPGNDKRRSKTWNDLYANYERVTYYNDESDIEPIIHTISH